MPTATEGKKKILLVDDSEIIRLYFRDIFWIHGLDSKFDLNICADIDKAKQIIKDPNTRPALVFSGLVMPIKQGDKTVSSPEAGFSFLEELKSNPELKDIHVIIFSAYSDKKYQDRAKELGADSFLAKQENMPRELVQFIENLNIK